MGTDESHQRGRRGGGPGASRADLVQFTAAAKDHRYQERRQRIECRERQSFVLDHRLDRRLLVGSGRTDLNLRDSSGAQDRALDVSEIVHARDLLDHGARQQIAEVGILTAGARCEIQHSCIHVPTDIQFAHLVIEPKVERDLPHRVGGIEVGAGWGVVIAAHVIQQLLNGDRIAARVGWVRESKQRIDSGVWLKLCGFRIIQGLHSRLQEHLAAACQQEPVGRLGDAVALFRPGIGARQFRDTVFRDRELRGANRVGLHEGLHRMIESRERGFGRARHRPVPRHGNVLLGEHRRVARVAAAAATLHRDRVEPGCVLLVEYGLILGGGQTMARQPGAHHVVLEQGAI